MTSGPYCYGRADGIVGALHEECRFEQFFIISINVFQKLDACAEHSFCRCGNDGIRTFYASFLQGAQRRKVSRLHESSHSA